jgi:hypothetical protein
MILTAHVDGEQIHDAGHGRRALIALNGLVGSAAPKADRHDRPRAHGGDDYTELYGPRLVEAVGIVKGDTPGEAMLELDAVRALLALNGRDRVLRFRRVGMSEDERVTFRVGSELAAPLAGLRRTVRYSVSLHVPDPRLYTELERQSFYLPDPAAGGGLSLPLSFPLVFVGSAQNATMTVTAGGTFKTPPVYTIIGPVTNPEIRNETTGEAIVLKGTIAAIDVIVVDVARRRVTLNGVERFDLVDPTSNVWAELAPGENVLRLNGSGISAGTTRLAVAWRDARI